MKYLKKILLCLYSLFLVQLLCICNTITITSKDSILSLTEEKSDNTYDSITIIHSINIAGNKQTREKIILRELCFKTGDTIKKTDLPIKFKKSKENLLNLSIFHFVTIESVPAETGIDIFIIVEEQWYLWPFIIIEQADRNFSNLLHDKSWSKVDYGGGLQFDNFRGHNETFKISGTLGYNKRFSIGHNNIYLDNLRRHAIEYSFSYIENDAIDYQLSHNKLIGYKEAGNIISETVKISAGYTYRKFHYKRHTIYLDFKSINITDTVAILNPDYLYNGETSLTYLYLTYNFSVDKRDRKYYPLEGLSYSVEARKYGLGLFDENGMNIFYLKGYLNKYWKLYDRFYFASSLSGLKTLGGSYPFYIDYGLGYGKNYIRGYEYYVIDGQDYIMNKNALRYALLTPRIIHLPVIPWKKFNKTHLAVYLNLSADAGYVNDQTNHYKQYHNTLSKTLLYSGTTGIDFVSYYNSVISFAYAINHMGIGGFYIHFHAPL